MAQLKDFYGILGVAPDAETFLIKAAYLAMLKRYHPDINPSADAATRTIKIREAYDALSNPETRTRYDAALQARNRANEPKARKTDAGNSAHENTTNREQHPKSVPPTNTTPVVIKRSDSSSTVRIIYTGLATLVSLIFIISVLLQSNPTDSLLDNTTALQVSDHMIANNIEATPLVPANLSQQEIPNLDFSTIEGGSRTFARVFVRNGFSGARAFSERCHADAQLHPSWQAFDRCAAFDFAGAHVGGNTAPEEVPGQNSFFRFQSDNRTTRIGST